MIITLIGIGLLLLFTVIYWLDEHTDIYVDEFLQGVGVLSFVAGIILTFICITVILCNHIDVDHDIYVSQLERESLIKQVEIVNSDYEDVSKAQVISNVYEWNKDVYSTKWACENPWLSWFVSKRYADSLEYIDMALLD